MASSTPKTDEKADGPWFLKYGFSVRFPSHPALTMGDDEFSEFLIKDVGGCKREPEIVKMEDCTDAKPETDNAMQTQNKDKAYKSTTEPLVDLFAELEEVVSGPRLGDLLDAAWAHDPLATLKIIFNSRSIHLGKASRVSFYKSAGWLAKHHPLSLITNLRWLSRPIIEKKTGEKRTHDEMVVVNAADASDQTNDPAAAHDVINGVSHGYWKDLLNLLALAANDKLDVLASPRDVLNVKDKDTGVRGAEDAKDLRHGLRDQRQATAIRKFETDPVYRGLHLTIARLFASQMRKDLDALHGSDAVAKRRISLCGKWAPSHERFHDRHTYIVSSIAELLHPMPNLQANIEQDSSLIAPGKKRETYLRYVREEYRKSISALRKHLDVVERQLSAKTYSEIKYDRVPSLAMNMYLPTFIKRDSEGFEKYTDDVANGAARISGATLLPSTVIKGVRGLSEGNGSGVVAVIKNKVHDGQWRTLVQRIKDSGSLESSIAVCDVSGSMLGPTLSDGTTPMDTSIGLSLLVAEVAKPPFGGSFITFSAQPQICELDLSKNISEKYDAISGSDWGWNTNLVAVFEDLILHRAKSHGVKQEDMVKRVFIFSDMHFDKGVHKCSSWSSSHERIAAKYKEAGYEMPELIYWNLAGGAAKKSVYLSPVNLADSDDSSEESAGGSPDKNIDEKAKHWSHEDNARHESAGDAAVAPKPATADTEGTAIVSGYSQGMLKVFLENGSFESPEDDEVVDEEMKDEGDGEMVKVSTQKKRVDQLGFVMKAIGHSAYSMIAVVD